MEEMQHRLGSSARYPHSSSLSNPLLHVLSAYYRTKQGDKQEKSPHAQHVNQMLLCNIVLLIHIPLQCCEDILLLEQVPTTLALQLEQLVVREPRVVRARARAARRDSEVFQLLAEYDDSLLRKQGVRLGGGPEFGGAGLLEEVLLARKEARLRRAAVEIIGGTSEERKDKVEAVRVKLQAALVSWVACRRTKAGK